MKYLKKFLHIIILIFIISSIASCGNKEKDSKTNNTTPIKQTENKTSYAKIDIDLSKLNDTMKVAQINQIMNNPANYDGKVIKAKGEYKVYYSSLTRKYYPSIIISDSTECCQQTLEFILKGGLIYPNGYPEPGSGSIVVVGVLERYFEDTKMYVHLINTEIL